MAASTTYALCWFGRLYPPISCFLNFACLMLYIAGVAGVAAFSFLLNLLSQCSVGSACTTFKIAFFAAHVAGCVIPSLGNLVFVFLQYLAGQLQWRKCSLTLTRGVAGVCCPMDIDTSAGCKARLTSRTVGADTKNTKICGSMNRRPWRVVTECGSTRQPQKCDEPIYRCDIGPALVCGICMLMVFGGIA